MWQTIPMIMADTVESSLPDIKDMKHGSGDSSSKEPELSNGTVTPPDKEEQIDQLPDNVDSKENEQKTGEPELQSVTSSEQGAGDQVEQSTEESLTDTSEPTSGDTDIVIDKPDEEEGDGWMYVLGHDKLKKRTLVKGVGISSRPTRGQVVTISYFATLEDGTEVDKHDRQTVTLGDEEVIQALDLCISLMELNEKCEVVTHPQYAYGSKGREPDIPADATLTYILELLVVENAPDYAALPVHIRVTEADKKRLRGNDLYSRAEYAASINSYTKALQILDDSNESHRGSPEELQNLIDTRIKCYNNLAAAQLKVEAWDTAIKSCEEVLKVQPENVKALFRKGKCLASKGDLEPAIMVLRKALKLEPETKIIHQELSRLVAKHRSQEESTRAMYQKMLGTNKATQAKKTEAKSTWWLYAASGAALAAVLSVGIAAYRYVGVN